LRLLKGTAMLKKIITANLKQENLLATKEAENKEKLELKPEDKESKDDKKAEPNSSN
jgi:hypothetical protein